MTKISLTKKQLSILEFLKNNGPSTPTKIGMGLGKEYGDASSWACYNMRALVNQGMISRDSGTYMYIEGLS